MQTLQSAALTRETNSARKKLQASICFRREAKGLDRINISDEEMKITKPEVKLTEHASRTHIISINVWGNVAFSLLAYFAIFDLSELT